MLVLSSDIFREQVRLLVDQSLKGLMFPIPDPLDFNPSLEEFVKLIKQSLSLRISQVLSLPLLPMTRRLGLHLEILLADSLRVINQKVVYQVSI